MSQVPNLVVAYHKGGRFDDIRILDVRQDLAEWEKRNLANIGRLDGLVRWIVDTVKSTVSKKCRVRSLTTTDDDDGGGSGGKLEVWELESGYPSALPDDLCDELIVEKRFEEGG